MTVSRFLRGLGYNGLSELKEQLRTELESTPLLISDRLARIRKASKRDSKLWENFDLEIMATLGVYELLGGTVWPASPARWRWRRSNGTASPGASPAPAAASAACAPPRWRASASPCTRAV